MTCFTEDGFPWSGQRGLVQLSDWSGPGWVSFVADPGEWAALRVARPPTGVPPPAVVLSLLKAVPALNRRAHVPSRLRAVMREGRPFPGGSAATSLRVTGPSSFALPGTALAGALVLTAVSATVLVWTDITQAEYGHSPPASARPRRTLAASSTTSPRPAPLPTRKQAASPSVWTTDTGPSGRRGARPGHRRHGPPSTIAKGHVVPVMARSLSSDLPLPRFWPPIPSGCTPCSKGHPTRSEPVVPELARRDEARTGLFHLWDPQRGMLTVACPRFSGRTPLPSEHAFHVRHAGVEEGPIRAGGFRAGPRCRCGGPARRRRPRGGSPGWRRCRRR